MSSALSKVRSVALSYGTIIHPTPKSFFDPAHALSCHIIQHLWNNWGKDEGGIRNGEVDLYNVNLPMVEDLLSDEGLQIYWTTLWRNSYTRFFKTISAPQDPSNNSESGPDLSDAGGLVFKFSPEVKNLIKPSLSSLQVGSDAWAIHNRSATVTPLRASYAEPPSSESLALEERIWKLKL
jgi:tubulin---tyrosine ligase